MTREIWKAIPGYEGLYEVSSHGRVRSKWHVRRLWLNGQGRLTIRLPLGRTVGVHRLVALAFLGPCPDGMEVAHNDGNPQNNHIENLRYDTRAGNLADCVRHGTDGRGERNNHAKLTEAEVFAIRSASGSQRKLAREFGVCQKHICRIKRGERWGHLGHSENFQ